MLWRSGQILSQKYVALQAVTSAGARGRALEQFMTDFFAAEHYRAHPNTEANGRQVDLFVSRGPMRLLVETKNHKRPAQVGDVDQLRSRLETAAPNVVGLLVSMSGFSRTAVARSEQTTQRPILLVTGAEVHDLIHQGRSLHQLLTWKRDNLTRHQRAVFASDEPSTADSLWLRSLPESGYRIVTAYGDDLPWWQSDGGFNESACLPVFAAVDWTTATPVTLDFTLSIRTEREFVEVLRKLAQLGWLSTDGSWKLEQLHQSWSGFGAANLVDALARRSERYVGLSVHHSETILYVDQTEDGALTLTANVDAQSRHVRSCYLSFVLTGWPLDASVFEGLAVDLPVSNRPMLQVGGNAGVTYRRLGSPPPRSSELSLLRGLRRRVPSSPVTTFKYGDTRTSALAWIARDAALFEGPAAASKPTWVEAIVVPDPLHRRLPAHRRATGLPSPSFGSMFAWLRSQHHLGDNFDYENLHLRTLQARDVRLVHLTSDWLSPAIERT